MKKILTIFLIMLTLFLSIGAGHTLAFGELNIEISDNYTEHSPQLEIAFVAPFALKEGDSVEIEMDEARVNERTNFLKSVTINGEFPLTVSNPNFESIKISLSSDIEKGGEVKININKGVFVNPGTACFSKLIVRINGEQYSYSYIHIIEDNFVKNVSLKVLGNNGFEVRFNVGKDGGLSPYTTEIGQITIQGTTYTYQTQVRTGAYIYVRFSSLVSKAFPSKITFREVSVNGTLAYADPVVTTLFTGTDNEMKVFAISIPNEIKSYTDVVVVFKGLNNNFQIPQELSGEAFAGVWTQKQTTVVKSNVINVQGSYVVKTNYEISPSEPDGENGFYTTFPTLTLTSEKGSLIESIKTYYKIDNALDFSLYTEPLILNSGSHSIQFYSVGTARKKEHKESIQTLDFKIDTDLPSISILSPLESESRFYNLHVSVSDSNIKSVKIEVNGIVYTFFEEDIKLPLVLFSSETSFTVTVEDAAGREVSTTDTIVLKN